MILVHSKRADLIFMIAYYICDKSNFDGCDLVNFGNIVCIGWKRAAPCVLRPPSNTRRSAGDWYMYLDIELESFVVRNFSQK
jgi:hypothetical protein